MFVKPLSFIWCEIADGLRCKLSNEDCATDTQCCSGRCVKLHEGTNPRCASSPIHYPCFFSYQCEDGLSCGEHYNCCSPYWGVCSKQKDCCDAAHVCREEDGFIYNRCLTASSTHNVPGTCLLLSVLAQAHIFVSILNYLWCMQPSLPCYC